MLLLPCCLLQLLASASDVDDSTVRAVAIQALEGIVSAVDFVDVLTRLVALSKAAPRMLHKKQYIEAILRTGSSRSYALVSDYRWYLLILSDCVKVRLAALATSSIFCQIKSSTSSGSSKSSRRPKVASSDVSSGAHDIDLAFREELSSKIAHQLDVVVKQLVNNNNEDQQAA